MTLRAPIGSTDLLALRPKRSRWPMAAAFGLALACVAVVGASRLAGAAGPTGRVEAAVVASAELRFIDRADGSIAVVDAGDGRLVERITGQSGFVRGTLRGLARERKREGLGADPPFSLVARTDGSLTLLDASTGRRVELESFGPSNTVEFARLLAAARRTAPRS